MFFISKILDYFCNFFSRNKNIYLKNLPIKFLFLIFLILSVFFYKYIYFGVSMLRIFDIINNYIHLFQHDVLNYLNLLYFIFSFLFIFSSMSVIGSKNPIHSLLFLVMSFFCASALLIMLNVEFISLIFIIIYVGAIAVLFLFCIMMVNIRLVEIQQTFLRYFPISTVVVFIFFVELILVIFNILESDSVDFNNLFNLVSYFWIDALLFSKLSNIVVLGEYLYVYGFIWFFISGLILLVSMFGAIVLTLHSRYGLRRQVYFNQFSRSYLKTIKLYN